jgi:hypothetical protein
MTEKDLEQAGFERLDVTAKESGNPKDWYYYTYDLTNSFRLLSCDSDEAEKEDGMWYVEIFDADHEIRFTNIDNLLDLISIINKAKR